MKLEIHKMSSHIDKQILRLFMLIHKVCIPVVRKFFEKFILCKHEYDKKFDKFLKHHIHDLYHMFYDVRCCKCINSPKKNQYVRICPEHFELMYDEGLPNSSHIRRRDHQIVQRCLCGVQIKPNCSQKNLDLSTLNAILKLFKTNLSNSQAMWLKMIIKERNTLCHLSDLNKLTESDTSTMWGNIEMAVMGLATDIPIEDYGDGIETQIDFLKKMDCSQDQDQMQTIVEEMKREFQTIVALHKQQNDGISAEITTFASLMENARINDKREIIECLSQSKDEILSNQDKNTKAQEAKLDSFLKQLAGKLSHQIKDQLYRVKYSVDSSFEELSDLQCEGDVDNKKKCTMTDNGNWNQDESLERTETKTEPVFQKDDDRRNDVCIYWKMKPSCCSKKEMDDIKANMRKAAQSLDCWFPYKITHMFDGSIVIGTVVSEDVLESKNRFEESICKFLDTFSRVSKLHKQVTIDVEIVISKSPLTAISNYCCYETCKVVTKGEKAMLATPDMLEEMVDASIDTDNKAIQTDAIKTPVEAYFYKLEIGQNMLFAGKYVRHYAIYVGCTPNIESWFHRFISCLTKYVMESPTVRGNSSYCSFEKPKDDSLFLLPISGTTCNLLRILDDTMLKYSNTLILRFGNTEIPQRLQHFRSFDVPESILIPDELLRKITLWSQTYFIKIEIEPEKWIISKMSSTLSRRPIFIGCISDVEKSMNQFAYHLMSYFSGNGPSYHMNVPSGASFDEKEYMIIIPVTGSENDKYLMERLAVTTLKSSNVLILEFDDTEIPIDFRKFRSIQMSKEHFDYYALVREVRRWLRKPKFRHERIPAESEQSTDSKNEQSIDGKRAQTYFIKIEIEPEKWIISKMSSTLSRRAIFIGCISDVEKSMNQLAHGLMSYFSGNGPSYHMNVPSGASFDEKENMIIIPVTGSENDKYLMERLAVTTLKSSNVLILEFDDTEIPIYFRQFRSIQLSEEHFDYYRLVPEVRRWLQKPKFPAESEESTDSELEHSIDGKRALTSDAEKSDKQANTQTESHVKQN